MCKLVSSFKGKKDLLEYPEWGHLHSVEFVSRRKNSVCILVNMFLSFPITKYANELSKAEFIFYHTMFIKG